MADICVNLEIPFEHVLSFISSLKNSLNADAGGGGHSPPFAMDRSAVPFFRLLTVCLLVSYPDGY